MIRAVDEFVLLDDVLYTKNDWRNRNLLKTPTGVQWITVPVVAGSSKKLIKETVTTGNHWRNKHWMKLVHNYSKASCFETYEEKIKALYLDDDETNLNRILSRFITSINAFLGIKTRITSSSDYGVRQTRSE